MRGAAAARDSGEIPILQSTRELLVVYLAELVRLARTCNFVAFLSEAPYGITSL